MSGFRDYDQYDALGLASLVRRKEVTPAELLEEAIARCERVNPTINAVIYPMYDLARKLAEDQTRALPDAPFAGVPFLLKDLLAAYKGVPMKSGSRFFKDFVPTHDEEYTRRLKAAGLNIFGKTATPELGITPSTEPELTGDTRNPWNLKYSPGGSSGGSSAAVAAGIVPMASASDGGGSIRIPASCCGLFGIKPSRGRVPSGPHAPDGWYGFIAENVVSRTVRDSAAALDALHGNYPGQLVRIAPPADSFSAAIHKAPGQLRIAFSTHPGLGETLHPDCKEGVLKTARLLEQLGHQVEEVSLPINRDEFIYAYSILVAAEVGGTIREAERRLGRTAHRSDFETRTWGLLNLSEAFTAADVSQAVWTLHQFSRRWMTFFEGYDVLLTSTLGEPPIEVGGLRPTLKERFQYNLLAHLPIGSIATKPEFVVQNGGRVFSYCSQTMAANVTGQPSMSVPLHWNKNGLPIGMMFTGRYGDESTLLTLAAQLEQAQPWSHRRPSVYAALN